MHTSGLEEVSSIMYGSSTVQHVLSGKAYTRVLHVHFFSSWSFDIYTHEIMKFCSTVVAVTIMCCAQ